MSNVLKAELSADRTGLSAAFRIWATDLSSILYSVAATEVSGHTLNACYTGTVPGGLTAGYAYPVTLEDSTTRYASSLIGWDGTNIVDPATMLSISSAVATAASNASTAASQAGNAASSAASAAATANTAASQAATAATSATSILAKLGAITGSGVNTLLGYFRAALSKAAGLPSDLTSGTGFNNSNDSLEALADAIPAVGAGGIQLIPAASVVSTGEVRSSRLVAYQYANFGPYVFDVKDQRGQPINLAGHALTFVVHDSLGNFLWEVTGCVVGGAFNNCVTVTQGTTNTQAAGAYRYTLWDTTATVPRARGELIVDVTAAAV